MKPESGAIARPSQKGDSGEPSQRTNWRQRAVFYATGVSGSYFPQLKLHSDP